MKKWRKVTVNTVIRFDDSILSIIDTKEHSILSDLSIIKNIGIGYINTCKTIPDDQHNFKYNVLHSTGIAYLNFYISVCEEYDNYLYSIMKSSVIDLSK